MSAAKQSRKGYSLIELVLVLTIGTILLTGMISWLVSLGSVAEAGLNDMGNNEVILAEGQIGDDIVNMAMCGGSYGNLSKVYQVSPLLMSVHSAIDGEVHRVSWRYNDVSNTLERSILLLDAQCASDEADEWVIWVRDVESVVFSAVRKSGVDRTTEGICTRAYVSRCTLTSIAVEITILEDVGGSITHYSIR